MPLVRAFLTRAIPLAGHVNDAISRFFTLAVLNACLLPQLVALSSLRFLFQTTTQLLMAFRATARRAFSRVYEWSRVAFSLDSVVTPSGFLPVPSLWLLARRYYSYDFPFGFWLSFVHRSFGCHIYRVIKQLLKHFQFQRKFSLIIRKNSFVFLFSFA